MTAQKIRDWLEVIGIFSVVVSLVFVGLQMRQTQEIALASQYQERANNQLELLRTEIESGRSVVSFLEDDPSDDPISDEDVHYLFNWVTYQWYTFDNNHFQFEAGFLPADHWAGQEEGLKRLLNACEARWIWVQTRRKYARQSFVEFVESLDHDCAPEHDLPPWQRGAALGDSGPEAIRK